ncbi:hypothetical protein O181_015027 [Austropuccinia psidii MF-1]|uniref:Uncharacterized protein n=1 Tax=Austropuccinia psidii MF-1 TaxID=1389203 RepID=A0A9Q3C1C3_9BASI|nr:hypothetical protein [Austropuccinia psidii MF-1]
MRLRCHPPSWPSKLLMLPPPATCNPYAPAVPSTLLKPLHPPPLTILTLPYYIHSVRWLFGIHNERNRQNMLSGLLCQQDLTGNGSVYSQCCG